MLEGTIRIADARGTNMDIRTVYENLTSVNIEEQKRIWDERGKGYYGEYLLFTELYQHIQGQCKMLMNLNIPTVNGKTTEIDVLMIHETGVYVFEVKHYKGTIYGHFDDERWTQYFRTQKNSYFSSPVRQNEYHISALKKMYPNLPIHSFIVFTNEDTEIKVSGWERTNVVVCQINDLSQHIATINGLAKNELSVEQIDQVFEELSTFSPLKQETVSLDGNDIPLSDYVNQMQRDYSEGIESCKKTEKAKYRKKNMLVLAGALIICAVILFVASGLVMVERGKASAAQKEQLEAEQQLEVFSKKFKKAEAMNGGDIKLDNSFFEIIKSTMEKSSDLQNTFLFSCEFKINGSDYGIRIHRNSSIVVQMKNGSVVDYSMDVLYPVFTDRWVGPFLGYYNVLELPTMQIYTDSADNIAYIKLMNVALYSKGNRSQDVLSSCEFELYTK